MRLQDGDTSQGESGTDDINPMKFLAKKQRLQKGNEDGERRKSDECQSNTGHFHGLKKSHPMPGKQDAKDSEGEDAPPRYRPQNVPPQPSSEQQRPGSEDNTSKDQSARRERKNPPIAKEAGEAEQQDSGMNAQQMA